LPADAAPSHVWADRLGEPGTLLTLDEDESRYLSRVCRAHAGEHTTLTDGRGALARARLVEVGRTVQVEIERLERVTRERTAEVWCGAPEGQRADWLIEKLAEFGVSVLQPVDCVRSEWSGFDRRVERWRRLALAGLRQSRGAWLLEIRTPRPIGKCEAPAGALRFLADPEGLKPGGIPGRGSSAIGLIGPAEGFDPAEKSRALSAGFQPIKLASNRLRCETAALAWAAWWGLGVE
jgi:16S rRNA (uracil1498-N3)-methyltransferase